MSGWWVGGWGWVGVGWGSVVHRLSQRINGLSTSSNVDMYPIAATMPVSNSNTPI